METRYLREMNCHYLVMKVPEKSTEDYQVPMLLKNRIPGLLPVHMQILDGVAELYYEVTSFQSLSGCFESEKLTLEDISQIMLHMNHVLEETGKYLLRGTGVVFDPEYVFIDAERKNVEFCYDPSARDSAAEGLMKMSRFVLDHINYEDKSSVKLAYLLFQESMKENVSVQDFTKIVLEQRMEAIVPDGETFGEEKDIQWYDASGAAEINREPVQEIQSKMNRGHDTGKDLPHRQKQQKMKTRSLDFRQSFGKILLGGFSVFLFSAFLWGIWILQSRLSLSHRQLTAMGLVCLFAIAVLILGLEYIMDRWWYGKNFPKEESENCGKNVKKDITEGIMGEIREEKAEI